MAGKYVYNATGQQVWVDDGAPGSASGNPAADPGGLEFGSKAKAGQHQWSSIPNSSANKESARLLADAAFGYKPTATAATTGPVTIDRTDSDAARAQQYAALNRLQMQAKGGGPSVANAMTLAGKDAGIRQVMAARAPGALGVRAGLGASSALGGQNAMTGAGMASQEQQGAWGALGSAAHGVRSADIGANVDQAKLLQQIAMANAGNEQAVALGNQQSGLQGLLGQIAAAQQYGGLVQDDYMADFGYRDYLAEGGRLARERRDRENAHDQAVAAQGVGTGMSLITMGAGGTGGYKPPAAKGG